MKYVRAIFLFISITMVCNAFALTETEVDNKANESVVLIGIFKSSNLKNLSKNIIGRGSGVAVTRNIVATNCHVALAGEFLLIRYKNKLSKVSIVAVNKQQDICLLRAHGINFIPVAMKSSSHLSEGQEVFVIGSPLLTKSSPSKGTILKVLKGRADTIWIVSNAVIGPGATGGGMFDSDGNLIGIAAGMRKDDPNISHSAVIDWIIQKISIEAKRHQHLSNQTL